MQNFSNNLNGFPFVVCADTGLKLGIISYNYVYFLKTFKDCANLPKKCDPRGGRSAPPLVGVFVEKGPVGIGLRRIKNKKNSKIIS